MPLVSVTGRATGRFEGRWSGGATDPAATASDSGVTITFGGDECHGTSMEPALPRPALVLPTTGGESIDLSDRPDEEVTVLFFGYTHCPDVCPTTTADLALARDLLAPDVRNWVQVLFVTEAPTRDAPVVLREWLDRFDTDFTGLIGGTKATATALTALHLPESTQVAASAGSAPHVRDGGDPHG